MRASYIYVVALLMTASCGHSQQTVSANAAYANYVSYANVAPAAGTPSCSTGLTISGGLSARCN